MTARCVQVQVQVLVSTGRGEFRNCAPRVRPRQTQTPANTGP